MRGALSNSGVDIDLDRQLSRANAAAAVAAGVGAWEFDLSTQQMVWSDYTRFLHTVDDAFVPTVKKAAEFFAPPGREAFLQAIKTCASAGTPWEQELALVTAKGRRIWVRVTVRRASRAGQVVALVGSYQDVTKYRALRSQMDAALHEKDVAASSLSNVQRALDESAMIVTLDLDGRIELVNRKSCEISGYRRRKLIGSTLDLLSSGVHDASYFEDMWRTIRSGQTWHGEICSRSKAGELFWTETTFVPIMGADARPERYFSISYDISERVFSQQKTERVAAEQAAQAELLTQALSDVATAEFLRSALTVLVHQVPWNAAPVEARIFLAEDGEDLREFTCAPSCQDRAKRAADAGSCHCDVLPAAVRDMWNGRAAEALLQLNSSDEKQGGGATALLRDGDRAIGALFLGWPIGSAMADEETGCLERCATALAIGVARRWQVAALERKQREAEAANIAKTEFLGNMSHEFRTPLNGVLGMLSALEHTGLDDRQAKLAKVIRESGDALKDLLNDVLDIARLEAGEVEVEHVSFCPEDVAAQLLRLHTLDAEKKGLQLSLDAAVGSAWRRLGAPKHFRQILSNLISNAVRFTEEGGVTITLSGDEEALHCVVADTGVGMSQEQCASAFEKFTQADYSITRKHGGAGLGLAIVKGLVERHDGEIALESTVGEGTAVRVMLPFPLCTDPDDEAPDEGRGLTRFTPQNGGSLRVLAADDCETNRAVLQTLLSQLPVELTLVENGRQAVELFTPGAFDLVLMDIHMPEMDGKAALQAIREKESADAEPIPIIAVTADVRKDQLDDYERLGFSSCLPKPINVDALCALVAGAA